MEQIGSTDEFVIVLVDEVDDYFEGRPGSAAKKAEADFRTWFARRSSRFSFSRSLMRWASAVVVPGRSPASTWSWLTQDRSVSGVHTELVTDTAEDAAAGTRAGFEGIEDHADRSLAQLEGVFLLGHDREVLSVASLSPLFPGRISLFRMLVPTEIMLGMAFPSEYVLLGNKRQQIRMAVNAVTPPMARDLLGICVESLVGLAA